MAEIIIYGASDDLIEVEGDLINDEFGNFTHGYTSGKLVVSMGDIDLLEIIPVYNGFWAFAVGPIANHDYDVMPGGISVVREWGTKCSYSETLTITVPQVATIRFENKG